MKAFGSEIKKISDALDKGKGTATFFSFSDSIGFSNAMPKISVKIPNYSGEPGKNVIVWLRQMKNIFYAQDLKDEAKMIHYAATGFEGAALY